MPNTGLRNKTKHPHKPQKLIFIDRDGVINYDNLAGYITQWKYFKFIPNSLKALQELTESGYRIIIISNQAGIGDGIYPKKALNEITRKMLARMRRSRINIAGVYYCLHGKKAGCKCRKPKIGLFEQVARDFKFDRRQTYFIGDKVSDMQAGKRFKLKTAFVLTGHGRNDLKKLTKPLKPDLIAPSLYQVSKKILARA